MSDTSAIAALLRDLFNQQVEQHKENIDRLVAVRNDRPKASGATIVAMVVGIVTVLCMMIGGLWAYNQASKAAAAIDGARGAQLDALQTQVKASNDQRTKDHDEYIARFNHLEDLILGRKSSPPESGNGKQER